jgi:hypothetical protein
MSDEKEKGEGDDPATARFKKFGAILIGATALVACAAIAIMFLTSASHS